MKYLVPIESEKDLDDAIEATNTIPDFASVHQLLFTQKSSEQLNPGDKFYYYEDKISKDRVYMAARRTKSLKTFCYFLVLNSKLTGKFEKNDLFGALDELRTIFPEGFGHVGAGTLSTVPLTEVYQEWFKSRITDFNLLLAPGYFYYMNEEQKKKLLEFTKNGLPLADGYEFDRADPEKDGEGINNTWIHSEPENLEATKYKLVHFPHSLIRSKSTGEAVAYEMSDSGLIHHLFTMPEHRRKGLGDAIEKDICTKVIKAGYTPFKGVELFNKAVMTSTDRSEFWTRVNYEDGNPILFTFQFLELPKLQ